MALFNFVKKKEEKEAFNCGCNCRCSKSEITEVSNDCCQEAKEDICCIKVLGSGCKNCHALFKNAEEAIKVKGISINVEYVTDMQKVMEYGVMSMPALVVNEKVVSMGKVLKSAEIVDLLNKLGL